MADKMLFGQDHRLSARDQILHIDSTSIVGGGGNDRLSAQAGVVYLRPYERTVVTNTNTATGNITLYLPEVGECIGLIIYILATIADSTTVTLKTPAGATKFEALDTTGDYICIMSTGIDWVDLSVDGIA